MKGPRRLSPPPHSPSPSLDCTGHVTITPAPVNQHERISQASSVTSSSSCSFHSLSNSIGLDTEPESVFGVGTGLPTPAPTPIPSTSPLSHGIVTTPSGSSTSTSSRSNSTDKGENQNITPIITSTTVSTSGRTSTSTNTLSLASFRKLQFIGKGDVGQVYLVADKQPPSATQPPQVYAMKVYSKDVMIKRGKRDRVLDELHILRHSNHPFIVPFFHSFQDAKHLYLLTEWCSGGEFYGLLQSRPGKVLCESDAKFYLSEVIAALEYLHLQGFIYRDLKPENILLHASGHVRLADFDLSKCIASPRSPTVTTHSGSRKSSISSSLLSWLSPLSYLFGSSSSSSSSGHLNLSSSPLQRLYSNALAGDISPKLDTKVCTDGARTNSFVGTEEYISPETIRGTSHSSSVDWWCLGILAYEIVTGTTPFRGENRNITFNNILCSKLVFPSLVNASGPPDTVDGGQIPFWNPISREYRSFITACLEKETSSRLGCRSGASQVKAHPLFQDVRWALLLHQKPPFIPGDTLHSSDLHVDTRFFRRDLKESFTVDGWLSDGDRVDDLSLDEESDISLQLEDPFASFDSISVVR